MGPVRSFPGGATREFMFVWIIILLAAVLRVPKSVFNLPSLTGFEPPAGDHVRIRIQRPRLFSVVNTDVNVPMNVSVGSVSLARGSRSARSSFGRPEVVRS